MEYLNKSAADAAKEAAEKATVRATKAAEAKANADKDYTIKKLISLGQLGDQQIAKAFGVSVAFVRRIKKEVEA